MIELEVQRLHALRAIACALIELKWLAAARRFEIAMERHALALRFSSKAGFRPDQPRAPKGSPDGGQWTGGTGSQEPTAGGGEPQDSPRPDDPNDKPSRSRERTSILKEVARRIVVTGEAISALTRFSPWMLERTAEIMSYNDLPRPLDELQRAASRPAPGYDIHHIVEQTAAEREGFPREVIDHPDNLVRVPRLKHQELNGWYQRPNADFGWQTPRDYLSGRSWEVRKSVGLEALRIHGVLKP